MTDVDLEQLLADHVDLVDDCWLWNGDIAADGAPVVEIPIGRRVTVRRDAHAIALAADGRITRPGELVWPRCGNWRCVRPRHMTTGRSAAA